MAFRSPDSMVNVVVTMVIDDRILFFVVYLHTIYSIFCVLRFEFSNFVLNWPFAGMYKCRFAQLLVYCHLSIVSLVLGRTLTAGY